MSNFVLPMIICLILTLIFGISMKNYEHPKSKIILILTLVSSLVAIYCMYSIYIRSQPYELVTGKTKGYVSLIKQGTSIKYSFTYKGNFYESKGSISRNFNFIKVKDGKYKVKVWETPFGGIVSEIDFLQEIKE